MPKAQLAAWNRALSYLAIGRTQDASRAVAHDPELAARLDAKLKQSELDRSTRIGRMITSAPAPVRGELAHLWGKRRLFVGKVITFNGHGRQPMILLKDVAVDGRVVTDHVWLRVNNEIERANPQPKDQLECECIVTAYHKGRGKDFHFDWALADAKKVRVLQRPPG